MEYNVDGEIRKSVLEVVYEWKGCEGRSVCLFFYIFDA